MKGLIILDGPDGSGKTTLGKRLCEKYGGKYLHLTYRWKNNMFAYHTAALNHAIALSSKQLVVIDRLWMSEIIYASVYRNGSAWPHMGRMMDRVVRKHAGMYILCFSETLKQHNKRFMELKAARQEMYNDTSDVWALYHSLYHGGLDGLDLGADYFTDLARGPGMRDRGDVWRYSIEVEGKDIDGFTERIAHCHALRRREQTPLGLDPSFQNFLGYAPEARYIIVGDQLSNKRYRRTKWPFYAYHHCSRYFAEKFSELGLDEQDFCWTNANEEYGPQVVDHLVTDFKLKPIFMGTGLVGCMARTDCKLGELGKDWDGIMHPQWYNRWSRHTFNADMEKVLKCLA